MVCRENHTCSPYSSLALSTLTLLSHLFISLGFLISWGTSGSPCGFGGSDVYSGMFCCHLPPAAGTGCTTPEREAALHHKSPRGRKTTATTGKLHTFCILNRIQYRYPLGYGPWSYFWCQPLWFGLQVGTQECLARNCISESF